jgi:hypothetical protein
MALDKSNVKQKKFGNIQNEAIEANYARITRGALRILRQENLRSKNSVNYFLKNNFATKVSRDTFQSNEAILNMGSQSEALHEWS